MSGWGESSWGSSPWGIGGSEVPVINPEDLSYNINSQGRINSYQKYPYGVFYFDNIPEEYTDIKFSRYGHSTPEIYSTEVGIHIRKEDTYFNLFINGFFIKCFDLQDDPEEFWRVGDAFPAELRSLESKLNMKDISALIETMPRYVLTGKLERHAILAAVEYANLLGIDDLFPTLNISKYTWRIKKPEQIFNSDYIFKKVKYQKLASETDSSLKYVEFVIRDLFSR